MVERKVIKLGDSLVVSIPAEYAKKYGFKPGMKVDVFINKQENLLVEKK